ncbi:MAG: HAMP domain-containing histidine kinase [Chloroflexota bacterium]|nr:HAMP domain-containing histidine kinase [Chloroflexota bacterium]
MDVRWLVTKRRFQGPAGDRARGWRLGAGLIAIGAILWLGAILLFESLRFVVLDPQAKTGFEMFLALGQLFGAMVLLLAPGEMAQARMRWVAIGLLILGTGTLWFAYLYPFLDSTPALNVTMYGSLFVRTLGTAALAAGMVPPEAPKPTLRIVGAASLAAVALTAVLTASAHHWPRLIEGDDLSVMFTGSYSMFPGLTPWHWMLATVPAMLAAAAAWGTARHFTGRAPGGWLMIAVMLLAAAQIHSVFWPSLYSSVLTTTSIFRLGMTTVVIVGGVFELRAVTEERGRLLAGEQERVRQLEELAVRKRDFTAIVAHELATPVTTIGILAQMIRDDECTPALRTIALDMIDKEALLLQILVNDIQMSMDVEQDSFTLNIHPVPLQTLVDDSAAYASTVMGEHPLTIEGTTDVVVLADRGRIGQVLRNLLNNAARHTPPGTRVTIRADQDGGQVRIEVADDGPGIAMADQARIFDKFERGSDRTHHAVPGRGLGLYLSRRIVELHGGTLTVTSAPGEGACFRFVLEIQP